MTKHLSFVVALLLVCNFSLAQKKLGLMIGSETIDAIESADEKAAAEWFQATYPDGVIVTPSTLANIKEVSTLWVAIDRVGIAAGWLNLPEAFRSVDAITALTNHVKAGGSLLLTNHATQLTAALGRIEERLAPGIFGSGPGLQNSDTWGVHPIIGNVEGQIYDHSNHAIYQGMTYREDLFAGIYCFESAGVKGDHNCMWDLNAYGLATNTNVVETWEELTNSVVLGTWNHVVDYCCAGIVDFAPTTDIAGRILAVGLAAYEWDLGESVNQYADQLALFTSNSLAYLLDNTDKDFNYGEPDDPIVIPTDDPATEPMAAVDGKVGLLIGFESIANIYDDDEKAAAEWFQTHFPEGIIITPSTLSDIEKVNTLWVAIDRQGIERGAFSLPEPFGNGDVAEALAKHVKAGGSLLLTNHATQLVTAIGRIDDTLAPNIFGSGEGGDNNDLWGANATIGNAEVYDHADHVLFTGLAKNNTLYPDHSFFPLVAAGHKEDHNCMWDLNTYGLTAGPNTVKAWEELTNSVVLGTWQHVTDYCCAGIIDFEPTTNFAGRILAIGLAAYEWAQNVEANPYQVNVEYMTWNALNYLNASSTKDTTTGIGSLFNERGEVRNGKCYTMAGRQIVDAPSKGIIITNGKKVIRK